jgi:hypothetical protein
MYSCLNIYGLRAKCMCVHVHVRVCLCVCVGMFACVSAHFLCSLLMVCLCFYVCPYKLLCVRKFVGVCTCMHSYIHTYSHTCMNAEGGGNLGHNLDAWNVFGRYVCMYESIYVCMYESMYESIYVCMYGHAQARMRVKVIV